MRKKNKRILSTTIISSIIFGLLGALTAILFAPDKGKKTRSNIANKGHEYKDYLLDNYHNVADSISHPFENTKEQTMRLSQKAIDKAKNVKAEVNQK